jgi:hypothetical protein
MTMTVTTTPPHQRMRSLLRRNPLGEPTLTTVAPSTPRMTTMTTTGAMTTTTMGATMTMMTLGVMMMMIMMTAPSIC